MSCWHDSDKRRAEESSRSLRLGNLERQAIRKMSFIFVYSSFPGCWKSNWKEVWSVRTQKLSTPSIHNTCQQAYQTTCCELIKSALYHYGLQFSSQHTAQLNTISLTRLSLAGSVGWSSEGMHLPKAPPWIAVRDCTGLSYIRECWAGVK